MLKQAKILNEETKLCSVILGNATDEFLKTNNYTEQDVSLSDIDNEWYLTPYCKMKSDEQKAQEEKERIANLNLTGADVERALIKALDTDFEDILNIVKQQSPENFKMVRAELKANHFYRGNPYVSQIGKMLGLTEKQLDDFFIQANDENKEVKENAWKVLLPVKAKEQKKGAK